MKRMVIVYYIILSISTLKNTSDYFLIYYSYQKSPSNLNHNSYFKQYKIENNHH